MHQFTLASPEDFPRVRTFYHTIIDEMQHLPWFPCWEKDVYPTDESLRGYIERGEMHLLIIGGEIAAAAALANQIDGTEEIVWPTGATDGEYATLNMIAVHPRFSRQGLGRKIVSHLINLARMQNLRALRLDVVDINEPAKRLYTGLGFRYVTRTTTVFDDGSSLNFDLYELPL